MQPSYALSEYKKASFPFDINLDLLCLVVTPTAPLPAPFTKRQNSQKMAPFLTLLADRFPNSSFPHAPQPKLIVPSTSNQNQWGPDSISTTVFGFVMFFMSLVALWQGRARRRRREQGTACFR